MDSAFDLDLQDFRDTVDDRITRLRGILEQLALTPESGIQSVSTVVEKPLEERIFIVHGRDSDAKYQLKDLLRDWKLEPIILHEQPNRGQAIIEKFEAHSEEVACAIVLLTPDDEGRITDSSMDPMRESRLNPRARQNVVFELGYFFAKLGREHVICLHKSQVELPSDISGVIYIPFERDLKREVYSDLRKELRAIGFTISD